MTYVVIALLTPPAPIRGLDIRVAEDVDDALDGVDTDVEEPELLTAEAGQQ
jgi:solute:Na+ symporter, SSS family